MNQSPVSAYVKDDIDFDMANFPQQAVTTSPDGLFISPVWSTDGGFSNLTYAPGEYLHDKDASYEFLDPHETGDLMEWSKDASSMLSHTSSAPMPSMPTSLNRFLSPAALTNVHPSWAAKFADRQGSYTAADDATTASAVVSERNSLNSPPSPTIPTKSKVSKSKGKSSAKPRSRSNGKPKSFSSTSSTSSSSSASARHSTTGHGGNHNVTLRTASRKPKPSIKTEEIANSALSPGSLPSSPDGNTDSLTSEERRARQNHNVVEKQYRNRLNAQFEKLLAVLPANQPDGSEGSSRHSDFDDRRMSKAEVLELARRRIHALEQERKQLRAERQSLLDNVSLMQRAVQQQQVGIAIK